MDVYEIDVTGKDIFSKEYGIIVLFKGEKGPHQAFAYKFAEEIQNEIRSFALANKYGVPFNRHFKIRIYTTILCLIFEEIFKFCYPSFSDFKFHICPDFASHENAIIQRIKDITIGRLFEDITADNYVFQSHNKRSRIQQLAKSLNKGDFSGINKVEISRTKLHNALAKIKYQKRKW